MMYKDYYNYRIYENGEVYSFYTNKFLKHDVGKTGYHQVTLFINKQPKRIKIHRLVGLLFIENKPKDYEELQINHKDGNKSNNHYSNLEYCTSYENNLHARQTGLNNISQSNHERWQNKEWAEKTRKKISEGIDNHHIKNPRFRYWVEDENGKNYSRQELKNLLGLAQSTTDRIIREAAKNINIHPSLVQYRITIRDLKEENSKSQSTIESIL